MYFSALFDGLCIVLFGPEQNLKRLPWLRPRQSSGKTKVEVKVLIIIHNRSLQDFEGQLLTQSGTRGWLRSNAASPRFDPFACSDDQGVRHDCSVGDSSAVGTCSLLLPRHRFVAGRVLLQRRLSAKHSRSWHNHLGNNDVHCLRHLPHVGDSKRDMDVLQIFMGGQLCVVMHNWPRRRSLTW